MEKITLDENYNQIRNHSLYSDNLLDTAEEIKKATDDNKISSEVAGVLFNILITKEARKESSELLQWVNQDNWYR